MDEDELLAFFEKNGRGFSTVLPLPAESRFLRPELPALLEKIKALGYAIKLDTNGAFPEQLEAVVRAGAGRLRCHGCQKQPRALRTNRWRGGA